MIRGDFQGRDYKKGGQRERRANDPTRHRTRSKRYYAKNTEAIKAPTRSRSNDESIRATATARSK